VPSRVADRGAGRGRLAVASAALSERDRDRGARARGSLTIYLGFAAGVGKTHAMLSEAHRLRARGIDVVVAYVEAHGRARVEDQLDGLETIPRHVVASESHAFEELDLDALLARRPRVALVDEYAHTNAPSSRNDRRWQDVEELLDAGVDVITTLNIQHLASLKDVVEGITKVAPRETVPDTAVRAADQIILVDLTPEALRRRIAEDQPAERADAALGNYFQLGNLAALRELALQWVADRAGERLQRYREDEGIAESWETQERVVVALVGAPAADEHLLRRAARLAVRIGGDLIAVRVRSDDGLVSDRDDLLERQRSLTESMGGRLVELHGSDVAATLVTFARLQNATQLVLGTDQRARRGGWVQRSLLRRVMRGAGSIDVHVIATNPDLNHPVTEHRRVSPLPRRRQLAAWILTIIGTPALALLLLPLRGDQLGLSVVLLVLLLEVVIVALAGGLRPALAAAVVAFGLVDWFYATPVHSLRIAHPADLAILAVFFTVAVLVSSVGARLTRRDHETKRARAEADALAQLATLSVSPSSAALSQLLEPLPSAFELDAVAVLSPGADGTWHADASVGETFPTSPEAADLCIDLVEGSVLVARGGALPPTDAALLETFAAQLRRAQDQIRLQADAASASVLADGNRLRDAILASVSHDLRTPLASIKAAATSVLSPEVDWSQEAVRSFCAMIDEEADRLNRVVANLLDLSRLQAGTLELRIVPSSVDESISTALVSLRRALDRVTINLGDDAGAVRADPTALEHVIANLVDNALNWAPSDTSVDVSARRDRARVRLTVTDHGPGIPAERRTEVLQAFQRLGDHVTAQATGIGLGLAVAHGLTAAMGGHLDIDDTPGGGATITVELPAAA
jgi:two-component system sensor histidine kinase KdpD